MQNTRWNQAFKNTPESLQMASPKFSPSFRIAIVDEDGNPCGHENAYRRFNTTTQSYTWMKHNYTLVDDSRVVLWERLPNGPVLEYNDATGLCEVHLPAANDDEPQKKTVLDPEIIKAKEVFCNLCDSIGCYGCRVYQLYAKAKNQAEIALALCLASHDAVEVKQVIQKRIKDIAEALHSDFRGEYYDNCYEIIPDSDFFVMAQEPEKVGDAVIYVRYPDGNVDFLICRNSVEDIKNKLVEAYENMSR